ncbi:hypothetical protein BHM03_00008615 [Ensete ventricosum]|nr:hypothetical protein BHM03_00008615 [Ensete ventricosum]
MVRGHGAPCGSDGARCDCQACAVRDGSTSDVVVAADLARSCLLLGCRRGGWAGAGLDELGRPMISPIILSPPERGLSEVLCGSRGRSRALALEAMKLFHDLDSVVTLESLALVRKRYNIPTEYVLHALGSR